MVNRNNLTTLILSHNLVIFNICAYVVKGYHKVEIKSISQGLKLNNMCAHACVYIFFLIILSTCLFEDIRHPLKQSGSKRIGS